VVINSIILFVGMFILFSMCSFIMLGRYEFVLWVGVFCLGFWDLCLFFDIMCFRIIKVGVCIWM
jgi:hypothetical protein